MAINEEFIAEYARVLGAAHVAIENAIGNEDTPGTAIFNINQIINLSQRKLPYFGLLQNTNNTNFQISIDATNPKLLEVTGGQVSYNKNNLNIPTQKLSIVRFFEGTYPNTFIYGMRIGFPFEEVEKSTGQIYSATLTQNLTTSSTIAYITNPKRIIDLGFPITAYIGTNTYVVFIGATEDKTGLIFDPAVNNGQSPQSFGIGTNINFIYEPKVKALYGLPVSYGNGSYDPQNFKYFPPLPQDWLPIADILILNPSNPSVAPFGTGNAIRRTAIDFPSNPATPIFDSTDAITIGNIATICKNELNNNKDRVSIGDGILALESYTNNVSTDTNKNFVQFWSARPLAKSSYFNKGVVYEGLERFEFDDSFAQAYYDITGAEPQKTLAIFRAKLFADATAANINGGVPTSPEITPYYDFKGISSNLQQGTYIYGISAVTANGESPIAYKNKITDSYSNLLNEITFSAPATANPVLFYHIYRRSSNSGEQTESRLTEINQITKPGVFTTPVTEGNGFINITTGEGIAFKISPAGSLQMGGIKFELKGTNAEITNPNEFVTVDLMSNNISTNKPNTVIATLGTISFNQIIRNLNNAKTTNRQKFILKYNYLFQSGLSYWIRLKLSSNPAVLQGTANMQLWVKTDDAETAMVVYDNGTSAWLNQNNYKANYKLLSFIDNGIIGNKSTNRGVYLTGKINIVPRQLRLYVPFVNSFPNVNNEFWFNQGNPNTGVIENNLTKNDMSVSVTAQNGNDEPITLPKVLIPQGTAPGTTFNLGDVNQVFDRIINVSVEPGNNVLKNANNTILWSNYDLFIVESIV